MDINTDSPGTAYSALLWRRKWLIAGTFLVTILVVALGTSLLTPVYQATATLRVLTAARGSVDWVDYDIAYTERLMNTYARLATSEPVLQEVRQRLGNPNLPAIDAHVVADTELMTIVAEGGNPDLVAETVNMLAGIIVSQSSELYASQEGSAIEILSEELARAEADLLQAQTNYAEALAGPAPDAAHVRALASTVDVRREAYASLLSQYERAQVAERLRGNELSIVEMANVPSAPATPNLFMNLVLGGLLGLGGGVGLAILFHRLDRRLYSVQAIQEVAGLPVLATVADGWRWWSFLVGEDKSHTPEMYHRLRASLAATLAEGAKTLLITSAQPGEGKSTAAINLAIAMGQAGRRVALVEANLHRPMLHEALDLRNEAGLTTVLAGKRPLKNAVQATSYPGVWALTSGPLHATPVALFSSPPMAETLESLEGQFDIVLLDGPSILGVADASVLASLADAVVLVVDLSGAGKDSIQAASQQLARLDVAPRRTGGLVGIVVNRVSRTGDERFRRYYRRAPAANVVEAPAVPGPSRGFAGQDKSGSPGMAASARNRTAAIARTSEEKQHGTATR